MTQSKINRLRRVLKFDQRQLDNLIQELSQKKSEMQELESELSQLTARRNHLLDAESGSPLGVEATQNRNAWAEKVDCVLANRTACKVEVQQRIDEAQQKIREQKARVKAIEQLLNNAIKHRFDRQQDMETLDLADTVLNQFLES